MLAARNFIRCLNTTKISRILIGIVCIIICGQVAVNYFGGSTLEVERGNQNGFDKSRDRYELIKNIDELNKIKESVLSELRDLESDRNVLQEKMSGFKSQVDSVGEEKKKALGELSSLKSQISQVKSELLDLKNEKPLLLPPVRLFANAEDNVDFPPPSNYQSCRLHNCFDYARCPLTSQFPVYVYPPSNSKDAGTQFPITAFVLDVALNAFLDNAYVTTDPNIACLYVVVFGEIEKEMASNVKPVEVSNWLAKLPYWHGDGRNHVIVHLSRESVNQNMMSKVNTGRAMVAQSTFTNYHFRKGFDVVIPTLSTTKEKMYIEKISRHEVGESEGIGQGVDNLNVVMQIPVMRKLLISFSGQEPTEGKVLKTFPDCPFYLQLMEFFDKLSAPTSDVKVRIERKCLTDRLVTAGDSSEFSLCGTSTSRLGILSSSTFSLIVSPNNDTIVTSQILLTRLAESLFAGAVPVVIGTHIELPFAEYVDWSKAAFIFPKARITELHYFLSSFPHADVLSMRRQGSLLYSTYFSTPKVVLDTTLALIRTRVLIPPNSVQSEESAIVEHKSYPVLNKEVAPGDAQAEFGVPPPEGRVDSPTFVNNLTIVTLDASRTWNSAPGPFQLFPSTPFQRELSSDAKFLGSTSGFRHVGAGQGGTGEIFQQALGGNTPREQFTVVMLTYKREEVLMQSIERLIDLPYLNKVIVVWNSPEAPTDELKWPDIGVPVIVIRGKKNSLNNRFIPYDEITTDAVLSVDDDAHLRHDEILFGFRVWRECKDRIVGYPGRFHAWDSENTKWMYNSQYTCELSMVLTGAAFFHKYYMYMYTYWLPQEIRDKVDEYINCEDIAMNFLVSHLTRKPPIKVTSRWTFRCPGCPAALSLSQSHFDERHECINYFVKVFGYMPLLNTQFRVDSVLFKTRLPTDMNKCFKFI